MNKNILHTYLNRLTNLTGNNRSILLLRLLAEQMIDLHELNFLSGGNSFSIIEAMMAGRPKKICQVLDSRVEANNLISKKLKRLQRFDNFIFEERGSNDLHIGWPFIRGKFSDGTLVRAPLLYFPVSLKVINNDWVLQLREDAGISFNKSFLLAYSFFNKVELNDELHDTGFDDFSSDSTVWRTQLYELVKEKIELNFNPDNFRDELVPFENFKKDAFNQSFGNGEIRLFPEAVLGIFPQAGSQLVPDYTYLIEAGNFDKLEDFFLSKKRTLEDESFVVREETLYTPFSLDAWQENAIKSIKRGDSIVVQGPPGTGKSQLICNLIADAIATGKKTLLVCQKRAALDVVHQRLQEMELNDFLGLVHDFRNDRKEIYEKIARQIDRIEDYKTRNRSVDIIQTERKFFQLSRSIDHIAEELDEFKHTLFDDSECGKSIKELYLLSDPDGKSINLKQEFRYFTYHTLDTFIRSLNRFADFARKFERDDYLWRARRSFAAMSLADMKKIIDTIEDIPVFQEYLTATVNKVLPISLLVDDFESFLAREEDVLGMLSVLKDNKTYSYFLLMLAEKNEETSQLWLSNLERVVLNCYDDDGPEVTLSADQLGKLQIALKQRMAARRSLIRRIRWEFFSEHNFWIKRVLVANGLDYNKQGLRQLEQRLDTRLNLEHHITALREKSWLTDIPEDYSIKSFRSWFDRYKLGLRAKLVFNSLREVKDAITPQKYSRTEFSKLFHALLSISAEVPSKKAEWLNYLTPFQIRNVNLNPALIPDYVKGLKNDFDNLCEFDKLKESMTTDELNVMSKLHEVSSGWDKTKMVNVFNNSLALSWIDYIETKFPILRIVSSNRMEELQIELLQLVKEKKNLSKEILLVRAREKVYEEMEYNRLNNPVTYRDLQHQANKKKKIWPLRKVITEFRDEVFKVLPCWMASPESVSAIFPMHEIFDLVIFDEASQCFAERGLPAMYRGKQLLIAGDDKQLQPFELYHVRWDEDSEEADSEVDSLLDLSKRYVSSVHLQGHYRSQSLALIDFSNRNFYNGRLQLLPDRKVIEKSEPPIEFIKVNGVWEQNTNLEEAKFIVEKVLMIIRDYPKKDLGIVTFNAPQQMLIMDMLEEESVKLEIPLPASLMIKNIENVQGDEKDIIIFSIGYAPDKQGKMTMQFGSLSQAGGENRLNVAITRAREKVVIVSSILPEQLSVEESKNDGPKLLKSYLEYAREVQAGDFVPRVYLKERKNPSWYLKTKLQDYVIKSFPEAVMTTDSLPYSDADVTVDNKYAGLILTDDDRFYSSLSAKDFHAYGIREIARKHWEHRIIYSRNFWLDKEKVENAFLRMINSQKS